MSWLILLLSGLAAVGGLVYFGLTYSEKYFIYLAFGLVILLMAVSVKKAFEDIRLHSPSSPLPTPPFQKQKLPSPKTNRPSSKPSPPEATPPVLMNPTALSLPQTPEELERRLSREEKPLRLLLQCVEKSPRLRYRALQKILSLKLHASAPYLRRFFQKVRQKGTDDYLAIQLLRTLYLLRSENLSPEDHRWLHSKGVHLQ